MGVSFYAMRGELVISEYLESPDIPTLVFYVLFEELGFELISDDGLSGEMSIVTLRDALENLDLELLPNSVLKLLKLCRIGIERGANNIMWEED